jgi:peptidoglycan hydrolase-like protein with peptidoglycan-binding domain
MPVPSVSAARPANPPPRTGLARGATGAAVREAQLLLTAAGFYRATVDGQFGPMTDAAVRAFQRSQGLPVDGRVGATTLSRLRAAVSARSAPAAASAPRLALGARGPAVQELQLRLKALGLYSGGVDGSFGRVTEAAVRTFQRLEGLPVDGWAGPRTMSALRVATAGAPRPASPASRVQPALDFGLAQRGAPYVGGGSPFRFGRPGDGRVYQMQGQLRYRSPRGVVGFDCSGLVVAMFRKVGVDLAARGLASSSTMKRGLPPVPRRDLRPGDLLVKDGHVVVFLGPGRVLEATSDGDRDGDGLGRGSVRVSDASAFLNDPAYVGRRVVR